MSRDRRESESSNGRRVVIIDDDENSRTVPCDRIRALKFDVLRTGNGYYGLVHITCDSRRKYDHWQIPSSVHAGTSWQGRVLQELHQQTKTDLGDRHVGA